MMQNQGILPFQMDLTSLAQIFPILTKDTSTPISIMDDGYNLDTTTSRSIVFSGAVTELILPIRNTTPIGVSFVIHNNTSHDVNLKYTYTPSGGSNQKTVVHTTNGGDTWIVKWDGTIWLPTDLNYEEVVTSSNHVLTPIGDKIVTFNSEEDIQMTLQNGGTVGIELEFYNKGAGNVDVYYNGNSVLQFPGNCKHFGSLKWDGSKWLNITKDEWIVNPSSSTPVKKDISESTLHILSTSGTVYLDNLDISDAKIKFVYEDSNANLENVTSRPNVIIKDQNETLITDVNELNNVVVLQYDKPNEVYNVVESAKIGKITTVENKFITGIRNDMMVDIKIPDSILSKHLSPWTNDPNYPTSDPGYGKYWAKNLNKIVLIRYNILDDMSGYSTLKTTVSDAIQTDKVVIKKEDLILTNGQKSTIWILDSDADISDLYEYFDENGNLNFNDDENAFIDIYGDSSLPFPSTTLFNGMIHTSDVLSELESLLGEITYYDGISDQVYNSPLWVTVDYISDDPDIVIGYHGETEDSENIPVGTKFSVKNNSKYTLFFTLDLVHAFSGNIHNLEHHYINPGEINTYVYNGFDFMKYEQSSIAPSYIPPANGKMLIPNKTWHEFSGVERSLLKFEIQKGTKFEMTNRFGKSYTYSVDEDRIVDTKNCVLHPADFTSANGYKFGSFAFTNKLGETSLDFNETPIISGNLGTISYIPNDTTAAAIDIMGTDWFVYIAAGDGIGDAVSDVKVIVSTLQPIQFQTVLEAVFGESVCTEVIGGFHVGSVRVTNAQYIPLKLDGTIWGGDDTDGQSDTNYYGKNVSIGIVPNSIWDLSHRPTCYDIINNPSTVGGMIKVGHLWFDIYPCDKHYDGGGLGEIHGAVPEKTSVYGGLTQSSGGNLYNDIAYGARIGKRVPSYFELMLATFGAPKPDVNCKYGSMKDSINGGNSGRAGCGLSAFNSNIHALGDTGVKPFAVSAYNACDAAGLMEERTTSINMIGSSTLSWAWSSNGPTSFGFKNTPYGVFESLVVGGSNKVDTVNNLGSRAFRTLEANSTGECVGVRYCSESTL